MCISCLQDVPRSLPGDGQGLTRGRKRVARLQPPRSPRAAALAAARAVAAEVIPIEVIPVGLESPSEEGIYIIYI